MSKEEATHKSHCDRFLYKPSGRDAKYPNWHVGYTYEEMLFWDTYLNRWQPSIMHERQLIKL